MVVCKFFLQGRCKFGQNCKYEHQINDNTQNHSTSVMRQLQQQQQTPGNVDTNTLVRSVQNDMLNTEKGGQWLLSSYAPFKDKPAFPGFEDRSFEEVRLGFYEATKTATVEQFMQQLQLLIKDAVSKIKALQNPSPEAVHMLTQIYNSPGKSQGFAANASVNQTSYNPVPANKSIFAPNQSVFAQQHGNTQSIFGSGIKQIFNSALQNSVFSTSTPQNSANVFTGTQQSTVTGSNNIFSRQRSPGFVQPFNNQQNSQPQNSVFSSQQNPPFATPSSNSLYANNNIPFLGPSNSPFAPQINGGAFQKPFSFATAQPTQPNFTQTLPAFSPPAQQSSPPFINQTSPYLSNSPFSQAANVMFPAQQQTPFSNPQHQQEAATSIFALPQQQQQRPFSTLSNIPEESSTSLNTIAASMRNGDGTVYSKIEDLSESEIKAFQSDRFEFGKIPEKPPTIEMCFS